MLVRGRVEHNLSMDGQWEREEGEKGGNVSVCLRCELWWGKMVATVVVVGRSGWERGGGEVLIKVGRDRTLPEA